MKIIQSLLFTIVPFLCVVIGAILQYLFSRRSDDKKQLQNLRAQAYVDYLQVVGGLSIAQKYNDKDTVRKLIASLTEIKARICVYGNKEVIEKLFIFERSGAVINTPEREKMFIDIIQSMRKSVLHRSQIVQDEYVHRILIGD